MSFIAGNYSVLYGPDSLGIVDDGIQIEWVSRAEDIITDVGGAAPVDGVYQGLEVNISLVLAEWNAAGAQAAFWPWATTFGKSGAIGRLLTSLAKPLVLTKCADAGNQVPATLTFNKAILAPGFNVQTLFGAKHRKVPLQMRAYPVGDNSNESLSQCAQLVFFSAT